MPEARTKIIGGQEFKLSQPYVAGHALTEAEAHQLNQVRCENIGNNLRKQIEEAIAKGGEAVDALPALVADYDAKYTFAMGGGGGQRLDPIEREARNLAIEHVKALLAKKGLQYKPKTAPEGYTLETWAAKMEANVEKFAGAEEILKLAKKRVAEKQKVGGNLAELEV